MKKIITLLLALACAFACAFAFTACGDEQPPEDPTYTPTYAELSAPFVTAYNAAAATNMKATVTLGTTEGELKSVYTIVKNADGTTTISYEIEKFAGLGVIDEKETETGAITSDAQGNYSDNGAISGKIGAKGVTIDLDSDKITNYSASANTLRITVKSADTASVLGTALPSDAVVVVTLEENAIASITLNYTDAAANTVTIVCEYNI